MATSLGTLSIDVVASAATVINEFAKMAVGIDAQMRRVTTAVDSAAVAVNSLGTEFVKGLAGAVIGVATIHSIKEFASTTIEAAASLDDLSDSTGSSVESLSRLSNIAAVSGGGFDVVKAATQRLAAGLAGAEEKSTSTARALQFLGISTKDPAEALEQIAVKLNTFADGAGKAAIARDLFGKAGVEYLATLKDIAQNADVQSTVTTKQAAEAERLGQQWRRLSVEGTVLKNVILSDIVPAIADIIERFREAQKEGFGFYDSFVIGTQKAKYTQKDIQSLTRDLQNLQQQIGGSQGLPADFLKDLQIEADRTKTKLDALIKVRDALIFRNVARLGFTGDARDQRADTSAASHSPEDIGYTGAAASDAAKKISAFDAALQSANKALRDSQIELADFGKAADERSTPALRRLLDLENSPDWATFTKTQQEQISKTLRAADANDRLRNSSKAAATADIAGAEQMLKLREDYTKALEAQAAALQKTYEAVSSQQAQALAASISGIENEIAAEKLRNDSIGLSRAAYIGLAIAQEESTAASFRLIDGAELEVKAAEIRIAKLRELQQVVGSGESLQLIHDSYVDLFRDIADAGANFIEDFVNHGSTAFKNLWANFKSWALSAFARIAAQQVIINITAGTSLAGVATNAVAGGSSLGNLLGLGNSASSLTSGGGLLGGLLGDLPSLGTALSNIGGGLSTFTTLLGEGAGIVESFTAGIAGLGSSFLAVLGPIGAVVGVVALAFKLFGKHGGPKSGGFASTDANAERFFTPSDSDATVRSIVDSVSTTYQKVAKSFGATLTNANFALGFDTDPKGTAPNRISASASVGGQQVFSARDVDVGRDPAQLQGELATAASRALLAALQASDLPQYLANILNSVTAATASTEQINGIIGTAQAIQSVVAVLPQLGDVFANIGTDDITAFVNAFGGVDALLASVAAAYDILSTDAEKAANATVRLTDTFAEFGEEVPKSAQDYRKLLESIDLTTEAGRREYAVLTQAAPAWARLHGTAQDATEAIEAQAEANRELVRSAEDFYNENFFSAAEKATKQQAEYTKQLDDFQSKFGVSLPRSIAGFRAYIDSIDRTTEAGEALYEAAIQAAPAVYGLATATESAADTISDAADAINQASASINVGFGAIISAGEKLAGTIESQIDTAIDGLDFGAKLSKKVELIGSSIAGLEQRRAEGQARGLDTGSLDFAIAALNRDNQKAVVALSSFVTFTAQYGEVIAGQLVQLQEQHAQDLFDLRQASPDVLAQLNATFEQDKQKIINGIASGVDGTLDQLEKLRKGIRDYLDGLRQSDLSTLKPGQKLAEAQAKFNADLEKARAGDADALQNITKDADTLLRDAREVFGSGRPFADIFDTVEASLEGLLTTSGTTVSSVAENSTAAIAAALPANGTLASNEAIVTLTARVDDVGEKVAALADVIDGAADRSTAANSRLAKQSPVLK